MSSPGQGARAAWNEQLLQVSGVPLRAADIGEAEEAAPARGMAGLRPWVRAEGRSIEVAAAPPQGSMGREVTRVRHPRRGPGARKRGPRFRRAPRTRSPERRGGRTARPAAAGSPTPVQLA